MEIKEMAKIKLSEWAIKNGITTEAVRLLREAIDEKWIPIVNGTDVDDGTSNCHLCKEFQKLYCTNCLIMKETGQRGCIGTPNDDWCIHHSKKHPKMGRPEFPRKVECPECKIKAQKVVDWAEALYKKCIKED